MKNIKVWLLFLVIIIITLYYSYRRRSEIVPMDDIIIERLLLLAESPIQDISYWYVINGNITGENKKNMDIRSVLVYISDNIKRIPYSPSKSFYKYYFNINITANNISEVYTFDFDNNSDIVYVNNHEGTPPYYSFDVDDSNGVLKKFLIDLSSEQ